MTTIAYRDGILAADSLCSRGSTIVPGAIHKLIRLKDGSVASGCGTWALVTLFAAWLENPGSEAPDLGEETSVIHMRLDGKVVEYTCYGPVEMFGEFEAWGSGYESAIAAMYCGLSAEEAVAIACKIDKGSGEPIFTMRVEPTPAPKKRKRKSKK